MSSKTTDEGPHTEPSCNLQGIFEAFLHGEVFIDSIVSGNKTWVVNYTHDKKTIITMASQLFTTEQEVQNRYFGKKKS